VRLRHSIFISIIFSACHPLFLGQERVSLLQEAEELLRQERYDDAVQTYERHLKNRLALEHRPEWENPYFYYLMVGDIRLKQDRGEEALASYLRAQSEGVDLLLIADRIRTVARWYERRGELEQANELLMKHRELDPLMFDTMLDRIARAITAREEGGRQVPDEKLSDEPLEERDATALP